MLESFIENSRLLYYKYKEIFEIIFYSFAVGFLMLLFYWLYKKIAKIVIFIIVIIFGFLAYLFSSKLMVPWYISILFAGCLGGLFCIPEFLLEEVDNLKKRINKLQ